MASVTNLSSPEDFSPGAIKIDFEGFSGPLTDQISGLGFHGTSVVDPATIGNSPGIPLSAATSGSAVAFSAGSRITFNHPVIEVGMFVAPSFITYIDGHSPIYKDLFLVALDSSNSQMGVVSVPVLRTTGSITDIKQFAPLFLGLISDKPISEITVDWQVPIRSGGATLFFDDLTTLSAMQNILNFLDSSISEGRLIELRLGSARKLRDRLERAGNQIDNGDIEAACTTLEHAYERTDGQPRPPDLVNGEAATELAIMIQDLRTSLGCI